MSHVGLQLKYHLKIEKSLNSDCGVAFGCAADAAVGVAAASETAFETGDAAVASEFALAGPGTAEESAEVAAFDSAVGLE